VFNGPILIDVSRKSFIVGILNLPPEERIKKEVKRYYVC